MTFIIHIFQFHGKSEHKQVKLNGIKRDMCKFDSIFVICEVVYYLNDFLFFDKAHLKND